MKRYLVEVTRYIEANSQEEAEMKALELLEEKHDFILDYFDVDADEVD